MPIDPERAQGREKTDRGGSRKLACRPPREGRLGRLEGALLTALLDLLGKV